MEGIEHLDECTKSKKFGQSIFHHENILRTKNILCFYSYFSYYQRIRYIGEKLTFYKNDTTEWLDTKLY